jgi:hypothetical protein
MKLGMMCYVLTDKCYVSSVMYCVECKVISGKRRVLIRTWILNAKIKFVLEY